MSGNDDSCERFSDKTNVQWQTSTDVSTKGESNSNNRNTKESHLPLRSNNNAGTQIQEDQFNEHHTNKLQPLPNQTKVTIQDSEGNQQLTDDDSVSFAYAVAYATAFINANNG